ncbi:hypothetical protein [Comamonas sediminis]|uniref:Uncharacterized protein n=1 Tax=Comamonas sediminis TaxID=1783360 RepID=A0ABV4B8D9_9BURK
MSRTDLVFNQQAEPIKGGPVRLVFGAGSDLPLPTVILEGGGTITGLRGHAQLRSVVVARGGGRISGLRGHAQMSWDADVSRGARVGLESAWQEAFPVAMAVAPAWQEATQVRKAAIARWQEAVPAHYVLATHWQEAQRLRSASRSAWQSGIGVRAGLESQWQESVRLRAAARGHWQEARPLRAGLDTHWQEALRLRAAVQPHWQQANPVRTAIHSRFTDGMPVRVPVRSHWQEANRSAPGRTVVVPPVKPPCYVPAVPVSLVFFDPADSSLPARLVFRCGTRAGPEPGEPIVIPIQRTYIVLNSIGLRRVSDGAVISAVAFSMALGVDSWTWSWQATIPGRQLGLIASDTDDPVQVYALINNVPYVLLAERWQRERRFASDQINVSGRGLSALLDAPYAPVVNHGSQGGFTAQQLTQHVLTANGVPLDWVVDWGLTDWLIPPNAWSLQGSYMAALTDIATAAGGYIQPHNTLQRLHVLPRYPKQPWLWSTLTPDYQLPSDAVEVEGTEWVRNPAYNRVYVSGEGAGVLGEVVRAGTPGDFDAPMVTHPLITDLEAARQRGIAELSAAGSSQTVSLSMQIAPQTGVIKPGKLIRYVDRSGPRLGIARSTSISWDGAAKLRQQIALEVPETVS